MISRLFKSQFKSMLLPGLIIGSIVILTGIILGLSANVFEVYSVSSYGRYLTAVPSMNTTAMFVVSCIGGTIFGIIVASYRFSLKKADVYHQAPFNEKTVRNVRILVGLIFTLIATITAFFFLICIFVVRSKFSYPSNNYNSEYYAYTRANIDYVLLFCEFIVIVALVISCYFISVFFALQTSTLPNAIILTLAALLILGTGTKFIGMIVSHYYSCFEVYKNSVEEFVPNITFGYIYGSSEFIYYRFESQIMNLEQSYKISNWNLYEPFVGTILLGGGIAPICFLQPEISGELCGKGDNKNVIQRIFHHTFYLIALCFATTAIDDSGVFIYLLVALYLGTTYYLITVWLNRSFKLKQDDWIPMIVSFGTSTLVAISYIIICSLTL